MNFEKVVMYNLNKKGLTQKMEIEEFNDFVNSKDITNVGVLKQREKLNGDIYKDMMQDNAKAFYNNVSFVRVHNVRSNRLLLNMLNAIK